jgi:hypothetical protein
MTSLAEIAMQPRRKGLAGIVERLESLTAPPRGLNLYDRGSHEIRFFLLI